MTDLATPLNAHVPADVQDIMAQANEKFPGFRLFGAVNLRQHGFESLRSRSYNAPRTNALLRYFSELSKEQKETLGHYILDQAEMQPFHQVLRSLRIVNGLGVDAVAKQITGGGVNNLSLGSIEAGKRFLEKGQLTRLANSEIFALFPEDRARFGALDPLRTHLSLESAKTSEALFAGIEGQMEEYRAGSRPLVSDEPGASLITRNDALKQLLQLRYSEEQLHSMRKLAETILPGQPSYQFPALLRGNMALSDEFLQPIARHLDIAEDSKQYQLLRQLPFIANSKKHPKQFDASMRAVMTAPAVERIFRNPWLFESAGDWLRALRRAGMQSVEDIVRGGESASGFSRQSVMTWEDSTHYPNEDALNQILNKNLYNLPTDEDGKINEDDRELFKELLISKKEFWKGSVSRLGFTHSLAPWNMAQECLGNHMEQPHSHAWGRYYAQEIVPQLEAIDTGHTPEEKAQFSILLEGRPVHVVRSNGNIELLVSDIRALAHDRNFMRRLETQLESIEKEERSTDATSPKR